MWKSIVCPGSIRTSHMRMCSFSNWILSPTWPSVMPRSAAAFSPCLSSMRGLLLRRQPRVGVVLDQVVGRGHLGDLDHVADAREAAGEAARRHAGDEDEAAGRLDHGGVREHAVRLAQLRALDLD